MIRVLFTALLLSIGSAHAQETVQVAGRQAFLHKPANPRASAVLVPGKGGIDPSDPLLRNRAALNAQGIATLLFRTVRFSVKRFSTCARSRNPSPSSA